jgi:hypothetical protein
MAACTAKRTGWAMSVAASSSAVSPASRRASGDQPSSGASAVSTASIPRRKAAEVASAARAMPAYCAPLPLKTKQSAPPPAMLPAVAASFAPLRQAPSAVASARPSAPRTASRCGPRSRCRAAPRASAAASRRGAPSSRASHRAASSASAAAERAESSSGGGGPASAGARPRFGRGAGAISVQALVPPKPKEFTPATGWAMSASASAAAGMRMFSAAKSICGLGCAWCSVAGTTRRSSTSMALSSPAMPEAGSVWPILVFTEPTGSGAERPVAAAVPIAQASVGSPTWVPVPCASK